MGMCICRGRSRSTWLCRAREITKATAKQKTQSATS